MNKIIIDVGNQMVKIGYIQSDQLVVHKILTNELSHQNLKQAFEKLPQFSKVYIGCINLQNHKIIEDFLINQNINYYFLSNDDFKQAGLIIAKSIDWNEIGIDILGFGYYLYHHQIKSHVIGINFGTATVVIDYQSMINGVLIGINFCQSYDYLLSILGLQQITSLHNHQKPSLNFAQNTIASVNNFKSFLISGFLDLLIKQYKTAQKFIISGNNRSIFEHYYIDNPKNMPITIEIINEIVIWGYYYLISTKKY